MVVHLLRPLALLQAGRLAVGCAARGGRLHLLQDRRGGAPRRDRRRGRAHGVVHGHQPVDARPCARDPAQPLAGTSTRSPTTTSPTLGRAKRLAATHARAARLRRGEPAELAEPAAWQTVFHFHVHVIPRYDDDPLRLPGQPRQADPERAGGGRRRSSVAKGALRARRRRRRGRDRRPAAQPLRRRDGQRDPSRRSTRPRAAGRLLVRAEGEVFTGGADVNVFEGLSRRGRGGVHTPAWSRSPTIWRSCRPDARVGARPVPHGRPRAGAGLRHDLGGRGGPVRPGGGGGRAHSADGRHPADGRACRAGAGPRVRDGTAGSTTPRRWSAGTW